MPIDAELASWVALSQVPGLGSEGLRRLLHAFASPARIFTTPVSTLKQCVKPAVAENIGHGIDDAKLTPLAPWLDDPNNGIVTLADSDYPQALLNISNPPPLLYIKGRRSLLNQPALAIVGSRNATAQGLSNAKSFAQALGSASLCIVSGMAHALMLQLTKEDCTLQEAVSL